MVNRPLGGQKKLLFHAVGIFLHTAVPRPASGPWERGGSFGVNESESVGATEIWVLLFFFSGVWCVSHTPERRFSLERRKRSTLEFML